MVNQESKLPKHTALEYCMKTKMISYTELQVYPWWGNADLWIEKTEVFPSLFLSFNIDIPLAPEGHE